MSNFWRPKKWDLKQFCDRKKNDRVNFDAANVMIGVDMKFEKKGLTGDVELPFQHYL